MTYLPVTPTSSAASSLNDADTISVTQGGVIKTAPLSLLKSYIGTGGAAATNGLLLRSGAYLTLRNGTHLAHR